MRVITARQEGFVSTADRIFQSGKAALKAREAANAVMDSVLAAVSAKKRPILRSLHGGRMLGDVSEKLQSRVSTPA
jgi:hypothetical protein